MVSGMKKVEYLDSTEIRVDGKIYRYHHDSHDPIKPRQIRLTLREIGEAFIRAHRGHEHMSYTVRPSKHYGQNVLIEPTISARPDI